MSQKFSSAIAVVGIDIGKNSFHVVGHDRRAAIVPRQKWSRGQVEARLANPPPCLIGLEAYVGAHHLSRKLRVLGHNARLMPAKYVRPCSKGQKNDFRDAEAIDEAVQRPTMKFLATKSADQLDLQALHRVRERLVSQRTGIINQIRAFLLQRRIAVRQWLRFLRAELPSILATRTDVLSSHILRLVEDLAGDWRRLDARIEVLSCEIETFARQGQHCDRLMTVPGIGPIISSAMAAAIGTGDMFSKGRDFGAWLGLVPKQISTGDRTTVPGWCSWHSALRMRSGSSGHSLRRNRRLPRKRFNGLRCSTPMRIASAVCPAAHRAAVRQTDTRPLIEDFKSWFKARLLEVSKKSGRGKDIRYTLNHWGGLIDDGRIETDSKTVERSIKPIGLGRKN